MLNKILKMSISELILIVILTHLISHMMRMVNIEEFIKAMMGINIYRHNSEKAEYGLFK
jgi:hypothetical protein